MKNIPSTYYKLIKSLLIEKEAYRDDDELLTARVWFDELKYELAVDPYTESSVAFMQLYSKGKITTADTITRARRKVQEENKELRGNNYVERKGKKQQEVKYGLRNINDIEV